MELARRLPAARHAFVAFALGLWLWAGAAGAQSCGDGICGRGETCDNCFIDCPTCASTDAGSGAACGDGVCGRGEDCLSCPIDCETCRDAGSACGDGICSRTESCSTCLLDCGPCGAPDAGAAAACGDGICSRGESCSTCLLDCGPCGTPDAGAAAGCGDGVCGLGETCNTCLIDCPLCPVPDAGGPACGDGVCSRGEDCTTCAFDCEACHVCGDGFCLDGETCSGCPVDCGSCGITDAGPPDVADVPEVDASVPMDVQLPDATAVDVVELHDGVAGEGICTLATPQVGAVAGSVSWSLAPPQAVSTGVFVTGTTNYTRRGDITNGACVETLTATGGGTVCASVLGLTQCVPLAVAGSGTCTYSLGCAEPPNAVCDEGSACCAHPATATASESRTWSQSASFGPFACAFALTGTVAASLSASTSAGPGCTTCGDSSQLSGRATFAASGPATCTFNALGSTVNVTPQTIACGAATVLGRQGCGATAPTVGGAAVNVHVPGLQFNWFSVGGFRRGWESGDGC